MKKLLSILAILAATAAVATDSANSVSSEAVFGILKVTIPADQQNTIIAVPWAGCTSEGEAQTIPVKDLIKTTNLTVGDKMYLYDTASGSYTKAWQLSNSYVWEGATIANPMNGGANLTDGTSSDTISRGQAIMLSLATNPTSDKDIYLYGRYKTGNGSSTVAKAISTTQGETTTITPAFTLIAPAGVGAAGVDINGATKKDESDNPVEFGDDDTIWIANGEKAKIYTVQTVEGKKKFGSTEAQQVEITLDGETVSTTKKVWTAGCTIPSGMGAWYIRNDTSSNIVFTW